MKPDQPSSNGTPDAGPQNSTEPASRREALKQGLRAAAAATAALLAASGASGQEKAADGALSPLAADARNRPLLLKNVDLAGKTNALYGELKTNEKLQAEFINDPSGLILERFFEPGMSSKIPRQRISNANRLLYSIVGNDGFREWVNDYQAKLEQSGHVDKAQIEKDFAQAVVRYGDARAVQSLMEATAVGSSSAFAIDVVYVYDIVIAIEVVVVLVIVFVGVFGIARQSKFTAADFRALIEKMVARGRQLEQSGRLDDVYLR